MGLVIAVAAAVLWGGILVLWGQRAMRNAQRRASGGETDHAGRKEKP